MFLIDLILRVFGLKKDSEFKYEQGANLLVFLIRIFLIGGILVALFGDPNAISRLLPHETQASIPPQTVYVAPQQPEQPVFPALPAGDSVHRNGYWSELCWENQTQCTIGRFSTTTGFFQKRDGSWIDPASVSEAYEMLTENQLVIGGEYSMCEMEESVVWLKHPGDQFADELQGCIHVRYDEISENYYWFTNLDTGETLIAPYVSYNMYAWVYPIVP